MNNDKNIPAGFAGWSYSGVEWTDFTDKVPPLPQDHIMQVRYASDRIPVKGEERIVRIYTAFDGEEFCLNFVPSRVFFKGFSVEDLERCAVVRCKLMEVIASDGSQSWIRLKALEVMMLSSLIDIFPEGKGEPEPEETGWEYFEEVRDKIWECTGRTLECDITEKKIFYTDRDGKRHLILSDHEDFDVSISFFGNVMLS